MNSPTAAAPSSRLSASHIVVSHSNALISAGLVSMMQRISGCTVHADDDREMDGSPTLPLHDIDLLIADSTTLGRSAAWRQLGAPSPPLARTQIVLLTAAGDAGAAAAPVPVGVAACLSMHCRPDDLLNTVCDLIGASVSSAIGAPIARPTQPGAPAPTRGGLAPSALRRVKAYIETHLGDHIALRDLTEITGLSPCHFSRAFKQSIGMPPHRYLMSRRIAVAAQLVEDTDRSMSDIALEVGFFDQSHFTRVFTAQIGESPRRFRHLRR